MKVIVLQLLIFAGIGMALSQQHAKGGAAGITGSSGFATKLFSVLCDNESTKGENILISPLSLIQILVLLKDGATSQSQNYNQLSNLVGASDLENAISLQKQFLDGASSDQNNGVELNIATSLWTDSLKQSFISSSKSKHSAAVFPLPKQDLFATVNHWVSESTKGLIRNLFDPSTPADPNLVALLVNAVYFKGSWLEKFDESKTVDGEFHSHSKQLPARFMTASRKMRVIKFSDVLGGASVLVLDYGQNGDKVSEFSAIFALPSDASDASMNDLVSGLQSQSISDILSMTRSSEVRLQLPRFKLNYGPSSMVDTLRLLGMTDAFDSSKSELFNEMTNDPRTYVDEIFHGAAMEVSEAGSVAAAATGAVMKTRSLVIPFEMRFNRPFVVSIIHRPSGLPLFLGRVEEPELIFDSKGDSESDEL
jgi:serpin B